MAEIVRMPKLSDTMTEGVVAKWNKKVGDKVKSGDVLAEIETDKATMEFEAYLDGTLLHIGVQQGQTAPVDSLLAIFGKEGRTSPHCSPKPQVHNPRRRKPRAHLLQHLPHQQHQHQLQPQHQRLRRNPPRSRCCPRCERPGEGESPGKAPRGGEGHRYRSCSGQWSRWAHHKSRR